MLVLEYSSRGAVTQYSYDRTLTYPFDVRVCFVHLADIKMHPEFRRGFVISPPNRLVLVLRYLDLETMCGAKRVYYVILVCTVRIKYIVRRDGLDIILLF